MLHIVSYLGIEFEFKNFSYVGIFFSFRGKLIFAVMMACTDTSFTLIFSRTFTLAMHKYFKKPKFMYTNHGYVDFVSIFTNVYAMCFPLCEHK